MADSENKPSLPPLSPSPATSPGGGDLIISIREPETHHVEFIRRRFEEQKSTNKDNNKKAIPRVPHGLRRGKIDAYEPNVISIGPYHRGMPRLQAMEKRKLQNISSIMNSPGRLEQFIKELKPLEEPVRECYRDQFKRISSEEFVEMMLLDSYFIIGVLQLTEFNQSAEDPANLRDLTWKALYDLLLLENQIPFFLIQSVFDIIGKRSLSLISLAYRFCGLVIFDHRHVSIPDEDKGPPLPTHLLQLYHQFIISPYIKLSRKKPKSKRINFNSYLFFPRNVLRRSLKKSEEEVEAEIMIPNATVLHGAGIKFKKSKGRGGILDVKFNGGVLEIPPLFIHDGTFSLFNNLVALEDCYAYDYESQHKPQFTAYFKFLDHIINTVSDVALLQQHGIIEHTYGSEKEVAQLFNQLTRGATINPNNYLSGLYKKVNKYCKTKRHIWGTMFLRRHCSNPLTILSTIGFLFLLALTSIQTYFAVYAYFQPPS